MMPLTPVLVEDSVRNNVGQLELYKVRAATDL